MDSNELIDNLNIFNNQTPTFGGNAPTQYADQQTEYYGWQTRAFIGQKAKFASNFVKAKVQGVLKDFYDYATTNIRLSSVSYQRSTARDDDEKNVLFAEPKITYFPIGAKLITMGSTWLCTNPTNMGCPDCTAIIKRCNAVYNSFDFYGNVVTEPIIVEKIEMSNNDNSTKENLSLMNGYFNVTAQLNDNTKNINVNSRILLFNQNRVTAYYITGVSDFYQEFTGDTSSSHLLTFTIRLDELNKTNDDLTNKVADGLLKSFTAEIDGTPNLNVGENTQLSALFNKNGVEVLSTDDYPVTWKWTTSDSNIATVDSNGILVGTGAGSCTITATLTQNPNITATITATIDSVSSEPFIAFLGVNPTSIEQYESATITACYYVNGKPTNDIVTYSFRGGKGCYTANINSNELTITCQKESSTKLTVTAKVGTVSNSLQIALVGF